MKGVAVVALLMALCWRFSPASGTAVTETLSLAWGQNISGSLGDGTQAERHLPVSIQGVGGDGWLSNARAVEGGGEHSVALLSDGTVLAWGSNTGGQLGVGTMNGGSDTPVQVANGFGGVLNHVVALAAGGSHTLALTDYHTVWAWGTDGSGTGHSFPTYALTDAKAIAAGRGHSLAIKNNGTVWGWGANSGWQLGDLTHENRPAPVQVFNEAGNGYLTGAVAVAAGREFSLALLPDGNILEWGVLGKQWLGAIIEELPVRVPSSELSGHAVAIAGGDYHSLALGDDGTVWAWGSNEQGQLGDGSNDTQRLVPVRVKGVGGVGYLSNIVSIAAGGNHSLALGSDGRVYAWGSNAGGVLGDGGTSKSGLPVAVLRPDGKAGVDRVKTISAGTASSFATAETVSATLDAPEISRTTSVPVTVSGSGQFPVNGYYVGELSTAPPVDSPSWQAVPPTTATLSSGDGEKTLYAFVRDDHGFVSPPAVGMVVLDTTAPVASLKVPRYTRARRIPVTFTATDNREVTGYFLSAVGIAPSLNAAGWSATAPHVFTVSEPDGMKRLFAWTRDEAGNLSRAVAARTQLDRVPPVVTVRSPRAGAVLSELREIRGSVIDHIPSSGLASARYALRWKQGSTCKWWKPARAALVAGPCSKPAWANFPALRAWAKQVGRIDEPGGYVLYVEARDRAGGVGRASQPFTIAARD